MRILLINPNTSVNITDRLMAAASAATSADTELVPVTAHRGVPYIASRIEAAIASNVVMELLAEHSDGIDGPSSPLLGTRAWALPENSWITPS